MTARYEVDPGPQMLVDSVEVEVVGPGADEPELRSLVEGFPLAEGDPLRHAAYDRGKGELASWAADNGYLDADFELAELRIDRERDVGSVALRMATGPRYLFGPVELEQQILDPDVLRGYVRFEPGTPFDLGEVARLQDDLSNSPYFQRVEVLVEQERAEGLEVPLRVEMTPAARQKWDLGVGYGTDTGARASVALDLRRVNRRGHRGSLGLTISEIERSFEAHYLVPGPYPRTDVVSYSLGYQEEVTDASTSETELAGVGLTQSRGRWREAFGLHYRRADYEVGVDRGISELVVAEASWSRVKADDRIYPSSGHRFQVGVRAADEALGSDSSFVQATVDAKAIRSLGSRLRAIGRVGLGRTWTSQFRQLPPEIRFFAGGDQSVRGYGYHELGRLDEEGNVIGGETQLTAGLELDSLFLDLGKLGRWGAAVFYDVGGAAASLGDGLERGAGVGVRWLSPIGPIRADVAWAVSEPDSPVRFHFTIGPDL